MGFKHSIGINRLFNRSICLWYMKRREAENIAFNKDVSTFVDGQMQCDEFRFTLVF